MAGSILFGPFADRYGPQSLIAFRPFMFTGFSWRPLYLIAGRVKYAFSFSFGWRLSAGLPMLSYRYR